MTSPPGSRRPPLRRLARTTAPALLPACAAGLLLARLAPDVRSKPIFEDESLAGLVSAHGVHDVLLAVYDRGGAPLHFLLASVVLAVDPSAEALRWLSAAFAVGAVPLCFDLARRLGGRTAGEAAAFAAASSQLLGVYGSFGRMYALLVFVSALALDLFVRAVQEPTRRSCGAAAGAAWLLPAVHPFGAVLVGAEAVVAAVLWRGRELRRSLPVLALAAILVPFAVVDLRLADRFSAGLTGPQSVVSPRRAAAVLVRALGGFTGGREPVLLVFAALAAAGAAILWRRGGRAFLAVGAVALVTLPALLVLGRSDRSFSDHFASRQLIFALPVWTTLVGIGAARATGRTPPPLRAGVGGLLLALALLAPSAVPDPRSQVSGTRAALAAPRAWLDSEITPGAVLFPSSPVFLAALPAARHARALPREQPVLVRRALRRVPLPVPAVFVAVPLDGVRERTAALRSALGPGFRIRVYRYWLLLEAPGPFRDRLTVLERIDESLEATRASLGSSTVTARGYLRQGIASVCGALRSLGGRCSSSGEGRT